MQRKLYILVVLATFFMAASAHAQFSAVPDPIQYIVSPESPGPNETVRIEVQGVGPFIGNSTITWQQDGKTVSSGVGQTTYSFTTGGVGSATRIHIIINSSQGRFTHDFVFAPSVVDLVWEADTSAPLFYLGKQLYSAGSTLKVVAFPTIASGRSVVSNDKLSFQWSRKDALVPEASGLGKNVFIFSGDGIQNGENIGVDVLLSGTKVGHGEVFIPATQPQVVLYDRDPLRGELLDFALPSGLNLNVKEITLEAEPYYFANDSIQKGRLAYAWQLNGSDTSGPDSARGMLTLRQTSQGSGAATVAVSLQNNDPDKFTQAATQTLQILFGQSGGTSFSSLFGL